MDEQTPGGGGMANTPPFPRPERPGEMPPAEPETAPPGPSKAPDQGSDLAAFGDPLPSSDAAIDEPARPGDRVIELDAASDGATNGAEEADLASEYPDETELPPRTGSRQDDLHRRAAGGSYRGFARFADRLDEAADRLGSIADSRIPDEGPYARAGEIAHSASHWMEGVADYFRSADIRQLQDDLERQVREKPVQTLLLAAGAGWILGRIMR